MKSRDIRDKEDDLQADYPKLTKAERRTRRAEIAALIEKEIDELDAEKDGKRQDTKNHSKATASRFDKENQQTPVPDTHHASVPLLRSAGTVFLPSSKMPPALGPASIVNMKVASYFSALNNGEVSIPNSSDTEEDSDPGFQPLASLKISPVVVTAHPGDKTANSSDTEPDSQDPFPLVEAATPAHALPLQLKSQLDNPSATTPKPAVHQVESRPQNRTRYSDGGAGAHLSVTQYADEERPRKMRRLSSAGPSDHCARISVDEPGSSAATSLYVNNSGDTPRRKQNRDRAVGTSGLVKIAGKNSGKGRQNETPIKMETPPPITNMHASSSRQLADYSAYKGRGRYANDGFGGNSGINAQFGIDPAQNAGKDFQFDDVVRKREDRRRLEAGDCECCSNYYDAIGPMPNRLHAPLWRSPPSSSGEGKRCLRTGSTETDGAAEIMSHKQAISRHRHRWARATTPPSYWNIGFPSTQEVVSINDKAREMHQHKQILVQEEADLDGSRYHKKL
ncbi:DNA repair protein endonuclease SAE2/CtIP C-terminus-domain-containing protein [Mycena pura]|uniref:DNA repair protein endonuclease SAE2/CtIP C-terminus-domain-containing protein n=1 Tax=Mycena pura TaxID=153505 RepID=A0AAD6VML2_9AGAR|nr:DNA repair protein endonuclease SAE2/CtIP C-terminus-domain-containing protein [Mycena pura]